MPQQLEVRREDLTEVVQQLTKNVEEPLLRAFSSQAQQEYEAEGKMKPHDGSLSVGCGVFFGSDLEYVKGFLRKMLIVTSQELLDPEQKAIDTRVKGYYQPLRDKLDQQLGEGNYDAFRILEECHKHDTITKESPLGYVFTKRGEVGQNEILAEIRIVN
jgi:hypothetical protein